MAENDKQFHAYQMPAAVMESPHCTTTLVRKSRFLAQTCQCASRGAARDFLELIRARHPDATHNCWAFAAGPPGDTALVGSGDDGEPRGTAGRPMLNALLHCGIGQICVVVSRWFGGIKLGTGGLARAYQDAVLENVKTLALVSAVPRCNWQLRAEYALLPAIRRALTGLDVEIVSREFGEEAAMILSAPMDKCLELELALAGISNGQARLVRCPTGCAP